MKVIPTDVYDTDGNIHAVEFNNTNGEFVIEAIWDPADEQTSENRTAFRKWAYQMVKQIGYELAI
jgi:hypothetical protein